MIHEYIIDIQVDLNKTIKDDYIRHYCKLTFAQMLGITTIPESLFNNEDHILF